MLWWNSYFIELIDMSGEERDINEAPQIEGGKMPGHHLAPSEHPRRTCALGLILNRKFIQECKISPRLKLREDQ